MVVDGLAKCSNLQHLHFNAVPLVSLAQGPAPGVAAFLTQLQHMQQLTRLTLKMCCGRLVQRFNPDSVPAEAFAGLTASSKLQHLDFSGNEMPHDSWKHVLPEGRQLTQLTTLVAALHGDQSYWLHDDSTRLVRCCPNLQHVGLRPRQPLTAQALAPLQGLAKLRVLACLRQADWMMQALEQLLS